MNQKPVKITKRKILYCKPCKGCGLSLVGNKLNIFNITFCSRSCKLAFQKRQITTGICVECKNEFRKSFRDQTFCSQRCSARFRNPGTQRFCLHCKQPVPAGRYYKIHPECRRTAKAIERKRKRALRLSARARKCLTCEIDFSPIVFTVNSRFCSNECEAIGLAATKRTDQKRAKAKRRGVAKPVAIDSLVVFALSRWTCQLCWQETPAEAIGTNADNEPTIDHIWPLAQGGEHRYENIQNLCRKCNSKKGNNVRIRIHALAELKGMGFIDNDGRPIRRQRAKVNDVSIERRLDIQENNVVRERKFRRYQIKGVQ